MIKDVLNKLLKHPLGALYGTLLGLVAFFSAIPIFASGAWEAGAVDLLMAALLIALMVKKFFTSERRPVLFSEKCTAWGILLLADILALLPTGKFPGSLTAAAAFTLIICAFVLYFSGKTIAFAAVIPALWCVVFIPYHQEIILLLSFPLRLSATALSGMLLNISGISVVTAGTSLTLPGLDIAITDACSGINQLDAFILIAFIAVELLHRSTLWKLLHFAFIIPAVIAGNALRIVLTVLLYKILGETVLQNSWHTVLGYSQIIFALLIFIAVGKVFTMVNRKNGEEEK